MDTPEVTASPLFKIQMFLVHIGFHLQYITEEYYLECIGTWLKVHFFSPLGTN